MGYYKNQLNNREFANDIMEESLEEKIWNSILALRKFERNLLKAEVLTEEEISEEEDEGECFCRKCGVKLQCRHAGDELHKKSLCGQCV